MTTWNIYKQEQINKLYTKCDIMQKKISRSKFSEHSEDIYFTVYSDLSPESKEDALY